MSTPLRYLLDTHTFLWAALADKRLGPKAGKTIIAATHLELGLSDVSIQEIGMLLLGDKIQVPGHPGQWLEKALSEVTVVPISADAAILAPALKLPHADPFDRIIVATAKTLGIPLITRDQNIVESGLVKIVW